MLKAKYAIMAGLSTLLLGCGSNTVAESSTPDKAAAHAADIFNTDGANTP